MIGLYDPYRSASSIYDILSAFGIQPKSIFSLVAVLYYPTPGALLFFCFRIISAASVILGDLQVIGLSFF